MEDPGDQRLSLRRKIIRDSILIFVGLVLITVCFVLLGVAQSYDQREIRRDCSYCDPKKHAKAFRVLASICFLLGFTFMAVFWWHLRVLKNAHYHRRRFLELQRLLGNEERPVRRSHITISLRRRNSGWGLRYLYLRVVFSFMYVACILWAVKSNKPGAHQALESNIRKGRLTLLCKLLFVIFRTFFLSVIMMPQKGW